MKYWKCNWRQRKKRSKKGEIKYVYNLINIDPQTRAGNALNFFIYDTIKIFLLLAVLVYAISFIRSFLPP